ncbi:hypothetical protein MTR_2g102545 [Medicago truncatula]|uniref:Uncharacterized protein n=1 Tax=Medicago truncatula TaxID=3880 RepID=A0A072VCQ3_MEDTR|nr:hypothetical protein MTR_2g102545 [Medicago truncatula]
MWHLLKRFVHEELPELRIMLRAAPPLLKKRDEGSQSQSQRGEGKRDVSFFDVLDKARKRSERRPATVMNCII